MNIAANNSGILEVNPSGNWLANPHVESDRAKQYSRSLSDALEDLIRCAEIDNVVRDICLNVLSRYGLTAWSECRTAIRFWSHGIDATLRWEVLTNPINRRDPPICVLSIKLGEDDDSPALYATTIADLSESGLEIVVQAVRSIIFQATEEQ